jgi:hypothetical protein
MTTRTYDTELHPDLAELRQRYERANQSPGTGLASGLLLLAGCTWHFARGWSSLSPRSVSRRAT